MMVKVTGLKEAARFISNLKENVDKKVGKEGIFNLAKNLQKRMKYRAPVSSGWLRRSIMVEKTGKGALVVVHAFYGEAVEKGRTKNLTIPLEFISQHQALPEAPGQYVNSPKAWIRLSGRAQPFVAPAVASLKPQIPTLLNSYVKKAIMGARR